MSMRTRRQAEWGVVATFIVIGFLLFRSQYPYFDAAKELIESPSHYESDEQNPVADEKANGQMVESISISSHLQAASSTDTTTSLGSTVDSIREPTPPPTQSLSQDAVRPTETAKVTGSPLPDRVVVMGKRTSEDTSWVEKELPDWQHAIYAVDDTNATLHTSINKGNEANPYLTYLVSNYHNLPSTIAFIHPHQNGFPVAWHTDAPDHSNAASLRSLNIAFIQANGYANLRCISDPGCPAEVQTFRNPPEAHRTIEAAMPEAWPALFGNHDIPEILATPCCSQFAVSREQVLKRPLEDYLKYLDWLVNTPLDDATSGRVFEYVWHVIFGQGPV